MSETSKSSKRFHARLHVLLARAAPLGLVIRRGPSKQVCTILWDRRRDKFQIGQWLKGRIYERRSDLSADGRYFLYFAMNGRWQSEAKGSWTAISRTPYLKAIALFPKGDCWHGGGLFNPNHTYWLNDGCGHSELRNTREVMRNRKSQPAEHFGGECPGVYYPRLLRDGWKHVHTRSAGDPIDVFDKPLIKGWMLRKLAHSDINADPGKSVYWDEHELFQPAPNKQIKCPTWEWADIDGKRLVWASKGKLFAARLTDAGLLDEHELFDFNEMSFVAIEAPY